jgi:acyl-CoA thioester hydrolase
MEIPGFSVHEEHVREEWIDYNGHMNVGYYLLPFENASGAFCRHLDLSREYRERTDHALFAAEAHLSFAREVRLGERLRFATLLLDWAPRWIHAIHCMYQMDAGYLAATNELLFVHVGLQARRAVPMPEAQQAALAAMAQAHSRWPRPAQAGRSIDPARKRHAR